MTTRARHSAPPYEELAARFGVVRRAWKRGAVLAGLAIVVTESIGLFTVLIFLDWLYQPQPVVRVAMWVAALGLVVYLLARHVLKPLLRKIPDEQIALYIEENRTELGGVLITAVEFGRDRQAQTGGQGALIDAVLQEAITRSTRLKVGGTVSFARLKKYLLIATVCVAAYGCLSVAFPEAFSHRVGRVLEPWRATDEDVAKRTAIAVQEEPLRIALSKQDTSFARGSTLDLEATLSKAKPADQPVALFFRSHSGGDWKQLPMTEIEKLNHFQGSLTDVTEDLDFYVGCGSVHSDTGHLTVFDPLVVRGLEMTTHFPDYVHQPDVVEKPATGDVTALVGTIATLRIVTSSPLKQGQLKWSTGETQAVTVDPQNASAATVSFPVKADATYDYTVTDVNGQQATSAAPLTIHAIADTPPVVSVKSPDNMTLTVPLGEVDFLVDAGDDFGVAGLDLLYSRLDAKGQPQETRIALSPQPLESKDTPHGVEAKYRLMLETLAPPPKPGEAISFHVEARDAKDQKTASPIGMIVVGYYEEWPTWGAKPASGGGGGAADNGMTLPDLVSATWALDNQKTTLPSDDLSKQCKALADKMTVTGGALRNFVDLSRMPQLAKVSPAINAHAKASHDALLAADTATATAEASAALALYVGGSAMEDQALIASTSAASSGGSITLQTPQMTMLEKARLETLKADAKDQTHAENEKSQGKAAAEAGSKLQDVMKQQDDVINKSQPGAAPGSASALGASQHDLAEKTRAIAAAVTAAASAGGSAGGSASSKLADAAAKTTAAANLMEEAARAFAAGKNDEGHDKATQAKKTLEQATNALSGTDRDKLEAAISDAASRASLLLDKQKTLGEQTDAMTKDLAGKKPDQRQSRDLQQQAYQQTQLGADAESLTGKIDELGAWATQVGQAETIRAITDAQHAIKRGKLAANMAGAIVDLNGANSDSAAGEQKAAEDCLQKLIESLQAGSDSLAADRGSQLSRAARAAQDAKDSLAKLMGQSSSANQAGAQGGDSKVGKGEGGKDAQGKGGKGEAGKDAQGKADAGKGEAAKSGDGKADGGKAEAGKDAQGGAGAGKGTEGKDAKGAADKGGGEGDGNGGGDEVHKLAYTLTQLSTAVADRDIVAKQDADLLKQMTMDKAELEKRLATDPQFLQDVATSVTNIGNKLEAEMDAKTEASKLFSSQREECPPSYRPLVNQYFEVLSQAPPAATPQPAPVAQP